MKNNTPWLPPINLWTVPYARITPSKNAYSEKAKEKQDLDERLRIAAANVRRRHTLYGARAAST